MAGGVPDFRSFLIELGNSFEQSNVRQIGIYFELRDDLEDGVDLLDKLEREGKINAADVSALIEPLEKLHLINLVDQVKEYQRRVDKEPMIRDASIFAGRRDELDDIAAHINNDDIQTLFRAIFIAGMPGVGKTSLAQEFVRHYRAEFHMKTHFVSCRGQSSLAALKHSLKEELKLQVASERFTAKTLETKLRYSDKNLLVVLDNVEELVKHCRDKLVDFLTGFVDAGRRAKAKRHCLVVTSRLQLDEETARRLEPEMLRLRLDKMEMGDSKALLQKYLGARRLSGQEVERLAVMCGHHPLSMALVANRLRLAPNIGVQMLENSLQRRPLDTLRNMEELRNLDTRSRIEGAFEYIFESLNRAQQELLIALATAPHDMSDQTAVRVSGADSERVDFDLNLMRLVEFNLVSCRTEQRGKRRSHRYSMHLLTRHFVHQFCRLDECPNQLRRTFHRCRQRLMAQYIDGMKTLAKKELLNPEAFADQVGKERANYLSVMGDIFEALVARESRFDDMVQVSGVVLKVFHATQEHVNFLTQLLASAKEAASAEFQKLVELHLADMVRINGNVDEAKRRLARLQDELSVDSGLNEMRRRQLLTFQQRNLGRCLKDDTGGNYMRTLNRSADLLRKAIDSLQDTSVFPDREQQKRELAVTYYDLGNTQVLMADQFDTDKVDNLRKARKNFEMTKRIFMEYDKKTSRLFDVHLSLAACDMELVSWHQSADGHEDRTTVGAALEHFTRAEKIAHQNGPLVTEDPVRMGNLYYARAVCLFRANDFEAAAPDAQRALKMRKTVFGTHNKTMQCYMMLGLIYSSCFGIRHRNARSLKCYEEALHMAYRLKRRKKEVTARDLESLEFRLNMMCQRMDKDFSEYERIFSAIQRDIAIDLDSSKYPDLSSSESDEDDKLDHPSPTELKKAFDDNASDDPDDEGSSAPSCARARNLSKKLKALMARHAELIGRYYDELDVSDMDILACILESGYPNMNDQQKTVRFERGIKLFNELSRLDTEPAVFLSELCKRRVDNGGAPPPVQAPVSMLSGLGVQDVQAPVSMLSGLGVQDVQFPVSMLSGLGVQDVQAPVSMPSGRGMHSQAVLVSCRMPSSPLAAPMELCSGFLSPRWLVGFAVVLVLAVVVRLLVWR